MNGLVSLFVFVTLSPDVCTEACAATHRVPFRTLEACEIEGARFRRELSTLPAYDRVEWACSGTITIDAGKHEGKG